MKKSTGTIDKEIGSRIRMRRMLIGMSQEKLGELLGVTFQQVQKYEKGANRISVGRMVDISNVLGTDIHYFFEGLTGPKKPGGLSEPPQPPFVSEFMSTQEGHNLMRAFTRISNPRSRRTVVQLATNLAESEEEEKEPRKGRRSK